MIAEVDLKTTIASAVAGGASAPAAVDPSAAPEGEAAP